MLILSLLLGADSTAVFKYDPNTDSYVEMEELPVRENRGIELYLRDPDTDVIVSLAEFLSDELDSGNYLQYISRGRMGLKGGGVPRVNWLGLKLS